MTLHTKYRPTTFDEVIGQNAAVAGVKKMLEDKSQRSFMFSGPAGTGKTTIARIIANEVGCDEFGLSEIDAATNTGIDAMREIAKTAHYKAMSGGVRCFIVDECHMLSKQAWNSLLKIVEEPPEHVYWIFCTTEPTRVPATVRSRCAEFVLSDVSNKKLFDLVTKAVMCEGWEMCDDILDLVVDSARGSPRRALVNLAKCHGAKNVEEAEVALSQLSGPKEAFNLAQCIFSHGSYDRRGINQGDVQTILKDLKDASPEGVRIVVFAYATSVWLNADTHGNYDGWTDKVLGAFEAPCLEQNKIGDIALRCARLLYQRRQGTMRK